MKLYKSMHFALVDIRSTGKKETNGILCFQGLPSVYGSAKAVCSVEGGVVISAGRNNDQNSRAHRLGTAVTVRTVNGVEITYGRLSQRVVHKGDRVEHGQLIGYEGSTGSGTGSYLLLEFRRNGRRIDGCEYLGILPHTRVFSPEDIPIADAVCRACGLTDRMRDHLELCPDASDMWKLIYNKLTAAD